MSQKFDWKRGLLGSTTLPLGAAGIMTPHPGHAHHQHNADGSCCGHNHHHVHTDSCGHEHDHDEDCTSPKGECC